jgi:hypothetical protein
MSQQEKGKFYYFLEQDGIIIGIASAVTDGNYGGLYGGGIIETHRLQGFGSEFMHLRLSHLKSLGCLEVFCQCEPNKVPFFHKLGFDPLFRAHFYQK